MPPGNARGDLFTSWLNPTSVAIGLVAVVSAAYIAAVWLSADAARIGRSDLVEAFRVRALWAAVVAGGVAVAGLIVVREDAERLWHGLTTWPGVAAIVVSALAGIAAIALVAARRLEPARVLSAVAVAAVIAGWALAQRPELLPGLTIDHAAAPRATLVATLVGLAVGSLILVPSLAVLFRMVLRGTFDEPSRRGPVGTRSCDLSSLARLAARDHDVPRRPRRRSARARGRGCRLVDHDRRRAPARSRARADSSWSLARSRPPNPDL